MNSYAAADWQQANCGRVDAPKNHTWRDLELVDVPQRALNVHMLCGIGPRAGSASVRIDPPRFLAGCRTRRLNQALSVLFLLA